MFSESRNSADPMSQGSGGTVKVFAGDSKSQDILPTFVPGRVIPLSLPPSYLKSQLLPQQVQSTATDNMCPPVEDGISNGVNGHANGHANGTSNEVTNCNGCKLHETSHGFRSVADVSMRQPTKAIPPSNLAKTHTFRVETHTSPLEIS